MTRVVHLVDIFLFRLDGTVDTCTEVVDSGTFARLLKRVKERAIVRQVLDHGWMIEIVYKTPEATIRHIVTRRGERDEVQTVLVYETYTTGEETCEEKLRETLTLQLF